jgi:hypothetical protein
MHQKSACCLIMASAIGSMRLALTELGASIGFILASVGAETGEHHRTHPKRSCMLEQCSLAWGASKHSIGSAIIGSLAIPWDSISSRLCSDSISNLSSMKHWALYS